MCSVEGHFWSMRPNSRFSVVPRTSTTTIFGCILKIPMLRILHPPNIVSRLRALVLVEQTFSLLGTSLKKPPCMIKFVLFGVSKSPAWRRAFEEKLPILVKEGPYFLAQRSLLVFHPMQSSWGTRLKSRPAVLTIQKSFSHNLKLLASSPPSKTELEAL